jgi:hypothetical protein
MPPKTARKREPEALDEQEGTVSPTKKQQRESASGSSATRPKIDAGEIADEDGEVNPANRFPASKSCINQQPYRRTKHAKAVVLGRRPERPLSQGFGARPELFKTATRLKREWLHSLASTRCLNSGLFSSQSPS